ELKAIEKQLAPFANVDWVAEGNADPIAAFQKRMQHDKLVQEWHQANSVVQQAGQGMQHATRQFTAAELALEEQKLYERIPEWKDATKRAADSDAILKTMVKDYGFAAEEVGGPLLQDSRVINILRDALKWRQAKANH